MQGIRPGWVERQRGDRRHEGHDEAKRNIDLHQSRDGPLDELNPIIHGQDLLSIHHDALHLLLDEDMGEAGRETLTARQEEHFEKEKELVLIVWAYDPEYSKLALGWWRIVRYAADLGAGALAVDLVTLVCP